MNAGSSSPRVSNPVTASPEAEPWPPASVTPPPLPMATADQLPRLLALLVVAGFFGVLGLLVFKELPKSSEAPLNIMLGVLGTGVTGILNYYYGASAASDQRALMRQQKEVVRG